MTATQLITLEQLLEAREFRAAHQKELIEKYRLPLVSFTVNMPGESKKTPDSSIIFREGCNALVKNSRRPNVDWSIMIPKIQILDLSRSLW